jgi:type II secretory pathway component PulJ
MNQWLEHTPTTWIVEDNAQRVVALVRYHRRNGIYEARQNHKKLGYYSTLHAAQCAVQPQTKTKPAKTPIDMPWDN